MNEQMNSTQRLTPRKRPHPARRARRAVGTVGVGGMLLMTGYMVVNGATVSAVSVANSNSSLLSATATNGSTGKATAIAAAPQKAAQSTSKASG